MKVAISFDIDLNKLSYDFDKEVDKYSFELIKLLEAINANKNGDKEWILMKKCDEKKQK
jgi:hypothetical protein